MSITENIAVIFSYCYVFSMQKIGYYTIILRRLTYPIRSMRTIFELNFAE